MPFYLIPNQDDDKIPELSNPGAFKFYTNDDINKIVEAVKMPLDKKRTVKLKKALEGCAADFFVESFRQKQLTASKKLRHTHSLCYRTFQHF